jgi:hydrophobe/amphiphile efflux-3 (HAE3) family protein
MRMRSVFARTGAWCVERPAPVIAVAILLAIVGGVGALSLKPDGGTDPLVDSGSKTFKATEDFKQKFGDDAVVILVRDDLQRLLLTGDISTLLSLENCLSGVSGSDQAQQAASAASQATVPDVCTKIADLAPSKVVFGPATFLDQFAQQAGSLLQQQTQAATQQGQAAGRRIYQLALKKGLSKQQAQALAVKGAQQPLSNLQSQLLGLAVKYGLTGVPKLTDPGYVSSVVFDPNQAKGTPKSKFSYLFPGPDAALIQARLRPDLSESQRREAIGLFRDAVADPAFQLRGGSYLVSGVPVVVEGLSSDLSSGVVVLLVAALIVMAIVLALVFGPPLRLLPLAIALATSAIAFGTLALLGGSLTMASIAVLPVLIGLSVDYAIQFHARFAEASRAGSSPPRAAVEAAAAGAPVIATAGLATAAGFLVLLLSPIPMVRSFGLLLVFGIAVAFVLALTVSLAILSMTTGVPAPGARPSRRRTAMGRKAPAFLAAAGSRCSRVRDSARSRGAAFGRRVLGLSIANPGRVIAVGALLAVFGWGIGTRTEVVSDIRQLVPADLPALQDVDTLQAATGVSGEVDVTVRSSELTSPAVISWMADYEQRVLALGGFDPSQDSCRTSDAQICPSSSLADLVASGTAAGTDAGNTLNLLPPYVRQILVDTDPETGGPGDTANIAFGIKVMPLDEQKKLIDGIRNAIDPPGAGNGPPAGVDAEVVGLPVLAADANTALSGNRYLLSAIGLLAVALALLAVYRSARRALVPLIPIVFATGWSALVVELAGIPLNPMSATLGALVIAIATEFSVLLSARFEEERSGGRSLGESLRRAYSRTGVAVMASGVTAIAGFAALIATDIRMLRDFGLVTVLDLAVALAGVLIVLPAALVWAETGFAPFPELGRRLRPRRGGRSSAAPG